MTTLDDHSRYLLYANFVETETAWAHIKALESVILTYGVGLTYYVDSHSIFRFVSHRDSIWQKQTKMTDEVLTQWKRVVKKCGIQVWHTLSAQAKGKIERPYRWLQDRIIRRCAREHVDGISQGRVVLQQELHRYNAEQIHSATGEIPWIRLQKAVMEGRNFFKPFKLLPAYQSTKDIFCLHESRKVNGYNQISWNGSIIPLPMSLPQGTEIELHIVPQADRVEVRLWHQERVVKVIHFKKESTTLKLT